MLGSGGLWNNLLLTIISATLHVPIRHYYIFNGLLE